MDKELLKLVNDLVEVRTKYKALVDYMINTSRLSYDSKSLRVEDCGEILRSLEPEKFNDRLEILRCEEKIK